MNPRQREHQRLVPGFGFQCRIMIYVDLEVRTALNGANTL